MLARRYVHSEHDCQADSICLIIRTDSRRACAQLHTDNVDLGIPWSCQRLRHVSLTIRVQYILCQHCE